MIPPPDCSAREDDPCVDDLSPQDLRDYEPDCEDYAVELVEQERDFEAFRVGHDDVKRELCDYNKYTDRRLRNLYKEGKERAHDLWQRYQYHVELDCFEVSLDSETSITVPRNGVAHTLTRKDKKRMKKNLRKRGRRLGILTKRGCSPRQVRGYEGGSFTTVVAAT
jgi:hypothetical protein